jgi:hypothetical protein
MKKLLLSAAALALVAACSPPGAKTDEAPAAPPAPVLLTEAEATAIADKLSASVASGDPVQILANYTPDAVAFSLLTNDLITTAEANKADTEAVLKLEPKATLNARKVQVLDADTFVDSGVMTLDVKKAGKATWLVARYTDVYQKQADGSWKIVTEHMSPAPQVVKTRPTPLAAPADGAEAPDTPPLGGVRPSATTPDEAPKTP